MEKITIGHNKHRYRIDKNWGALDPEKFPVNDCHEMVIDASNRLYLLTNNVGNNVLVYNLNGYLLDSWGHLYPGAHGLSIFREDGVEYLLIADHDRNQVIKTTLAGVKMMIINYPVETGCYNDRSQYLPTETAVAPNGDIYVTDGYGLQYVIQYDKAGKYIRHWGGRGNDSGQFDCAHGIAVDTRTQPLSLLITSRNHNAIKRFTMDGEFIETICLPGSFVCRPVIKGAYLYAAVFRSTNNMKLHSGYITILDIHNKVISTPGGSSPVYDNGVLQRQYQEEPVFMHPHDVAIDDDGNIYVCQWKANKTYPIKLNRISS